MDFSSSGGLRPFLTAKWTCKVTQPVQRSPLWRASWLPALDKIGGSKSVEVQRVWEVYDDRLQFMSRVDALALDASLDAGDVSKAWLVWSSAEAALADAYQFAGGPLPERGLIMGRGAAMMRTVWLGGPKVRRAVEMLLMCVREGMSSSIGVLLLLPFLTFGVISGLFWMC